MCRGIQSCALYGALYLIYTYALVNQKKEHFKSVDHKKALVISQDRTTSSYAITLNLMFWLKPTNLTFVDRDQTSSLFHDKMLGILPGYIWLK